MASSSTCPATPVDDHAELSFLPEWLARGYAGVVGSHTQVMVESRFYVDGAWTPYRPHTDRVVLASRMQVRLSLGRRTLDYRVRVRLLSFAAYL